MYRLWTRHRSGTEAISVYVGLGPRLWVYRFGNEAMGV